MGKGTQFFEAGGYSFTDAQGGSMVFECETAPEAIRQLEDDIVACAIERGASTKAQACILLVFDELLTNIRLYAYPGKLGRVRVELLPHDPQNTNSFQARLFDWGPAFNPMQDFAQPDLTTNLENRAVGGLGLHLINQTGCLDSYSRIAATDKSEECNRVLLNFPLNS